MVQPVPETISFPAEEEKVLQLWKDLDVFQSCLKQSKSKPRYSFYDGPPFATGLPHFGHLLTGSIKDIVTRYAHQCGFHVERRFGWDTHGLPVEYEIDKLLGIKGPEDVEKMGIAAYNAECRKIVMRYAKEWEIVVNRLGRWMDFERDYKTMYPWFMESVWWVFKQLYDKGLVYKGFKVMPFSTACNTPLSNFESGQNYKEVVDPAVIVSFPLEESPEVSLVAWTTTPWTLPSNLALVVNPEKIYVKLKDVSTEKLFILMEARLEALYKTDAEYVIIERFHGSQLLNKRYLPLFPYFVSKSGAFRILNDTYVTEESGTGVVHSAPFFGEDDYRVCLAAGVIKKDGDVVCPVDSSGRFVDPVSDFKGEYVKDADKNIIRWLKNAGRLVHHSSVKHSYPFCWRSDTPLIYKAVPSLFVAVEVLVDKLLQANGETYWVPDFVKEKRFGNWLREARDWAVSRNRYWGTPIPLWTSEDGKEVVCVGSIRELEKLSGVKLTDLHREFVDPITIPSATGKGVLRRVPEVFDCWFESGSMPYAQAHYPFENVKEFEASFPADFVCEGIDQTRGWFYTLQVLATALFGKPAFKNLISNGLILASDGQKMSKRKKNYPDPLEVIGKYGADALRLYLINSPAVRADTLRFKEEGVRDVLKDIFLPWYNAYRFMVQNIERLEKEENMRFTYNETSMTPSSNIMDRWIMSYMQSLIASVKDEMAAYKLYNVVPQLLKFVDNLTNWYVRVNRRRLKGDDGKAECVCALETLFCILFTLIRIMAPFTPFLTECIYQNLRHVVVDNHGSLKKDENDASIHYLMFPQLRDSLIDKRIERAVSRMQAVIELGRVIRDRKTLPIKYPLPEVVVIHKDQECLDDVRSLEKYILLELNVRTMTTSTDKDKYGVKLRAEPDHKTLGARLKAAFKPLVQAIKELNDAQLQTFLETKEIVVQGQTLNPDDIRIAYSFSGEKSKDLSDTYEADANNEVLVLLNVKADQSMQDEGVAREVINRIQKLKKKLKLVPLDRVEVYYSISPSSDVLAAVTLSYKEYIESVIKSPLRPLPHPNGSRVISEHTEQVKGAELKLVIVRLDANEFVPNGSLPDDVEAPFCRYVNVVLCGTFAKANSRGTLVTVLLENPAGDGVIGFPVFVRQVQVAFRLQGRDIKLLNENREDIEGSVDLAKLHGKTIYALRRLDGREVVPNPPSPSDRRPFCRFVNVLVGHEKTARRFTVLLENPRGNSVMDEEKIKELVSTMNRVPLDGFKLCPSAAETKPAVKKCGENEFALHEPLHFNLKEKGSAAIEETGDVLDVVEVERAKPHDETSPAVSRLVGCLVCTEQFDDGKKFCQHLVMEHGLVIADSKQIAHLKGYADYWRKRFQVVPYTEICSPIVLNGQHGDGSKEQLYLLSSDLAEDRSLRERLKRKRLEAVLEQHDRERRDKNFERTCPFCKKNFIGNRGELFKHIGDDHNLSFGHPDNLVFIHMFLDLVEEKLEKNLQCLFCEKTFKDRTTLKDHMRKKLHKKINPKNKEFDKFYLINYLETNKNWEIVQAEDDSEIQEMGDESEEMWGDYYDKDMGSVCLFCDHDSPDASEIIRHMKEIHFFDLPELKRVHNFSYYEQVKLVNYVRQQMFKKTCIGCLRGFPDLQHLREHLTNTKHTSFLPDATMWNQPVYFFPTFENDNLLCVLEDESEDDGQVANDVASLPDSAEDGGVAAEHINIPLDSILWNESIRQQLG